MPADNQSGYGSGQYCSPEQTDVYRRNMTLFLAMRNATWLDRWQDRHTGEIPDGIDELASPWRADGHLVKWGIQHGFLDPGSIKRDGLQNRQIGRLTGILYHRSIEHRRALAWELVRYLDERESEQRSALEAKRNGVSVRTG